MRPAPPLDTSPVYPHLGWQWTLAGVRVATLALGLVPAALYLAAALMTNRLAAYPQRALVLLVVVCVGAWSSGRNTMTRSSNSGSAKVFIWAAFIESLAVFVSWKSAVSWPLWPGLVVAASSIVFIFAIESGQRSGLCEAALRSLGRPCSLSPWLIDPKEPKAAK